MKDIDNSMIMFKSESITIERTGKSQVENSVLVVSLASLVMMTSDVHEDSGGEIRE